MYCFNCGHDINSHRKISTITGIVKYVDCLQPTKENSEKKFGLRFIGICQCTEFRSKEQVNIEVG